MNHATTTAGTIDQPDRQEPGLIRIQPLAGGQRIINPGELGGRSPLQPEQLPMRKRSAVAC